jgi:glycosyltransferase involved in cell wall biosynthesis
MISIIMPMFNSSPFILETLQSIQEQSFLDFECIIVDDGSIDDSKKIVQNFLKYDTRFQHFDRPENLKKGASSCRNYGCILASGNFIQFFDSDDIMHPNHLQVKIDAIKQYDFVVCKLQEFEGEFDHTFLALPQKTGIEVPKNILEGFVTGNLEMMMVAPLWRKSVVIKYLPINENLHILEDHEFYARILSKSNKGIFLDAFLIYYRQSNHSAMHSFYKSIHFGIDSYLLAKKSVLQVTNTTTVKLAILKMVLGVMRMGLAQRDYVNCAKCFEFIYEQKLNFSLNLNLKLIRIKLVYLLCKYLGRGDTYLKKYLKL